MGTSPLDKATGILLPWTVHGCRSDERTVQIAFFFVFMNLSSFSRGRGFHVERRSSKPPSLPSETIAAVRCRHSILRKGGPIAVQDLLAPSDTVAKSNPSNDAPRQGRSSRGGRGRGRGGVPGRPNMCAHACGIYFLMYLSLGVQRCAIWSISSIGPIYARLASASIGFQGNQASVESTLDTHDPLFVNLKG